MVVPLFIISCNGGSDSEQSATQATSSKSVAAGKTLIGATGLASDTVYRLINGNMFLDVSEISLNSGANVHIWAQNSGKNQLWKVEDAGDGYVTFIAQHSGQCLDVTNGIAVDLTNVQQYPCNKTNAQRWKPVSVGSGNYQLVSAVGASFVLDVDQAGNQNGTNVQIYTSHGGSAQQWRLEEATSVAVFDGAEFTGRSQSFTLGVYRADQGQLDQVGDDSISGLDIPAELMVRACANPDGSGSCWTFRGGRHPNIGNDLNNQISRLEVSKASSDLKNAQDVRDALARGGVIDLPTGTYMFDAPLEVTKSGTVLRGNGSSFVFTNRFDHGVVVQSTEDVTLENFSIDFNPLPFTQGRVEAVAAETFDVRVDAGYSIDPALFLVPGAQAPLGYGQKPGIALIDSQTRRFKQEGAKTWANSLTAPQNGVLRVGARPQDANIQVGDSVAVLAPWWACAVQIWNANRTTIRGVSLWSAPGGGVCQNGGEGASHLDGMKIVPGPTPAGADQKRLLAINRDGVHIKSVRKGILFENSTIDSISDDGFNNEAMIAKVTGVFEKSVWISDRYLADFAKPGEWVNVYDGALRLRTTAKITSTGSGLFVLENADGVQVGDRVVNASRTGEGTIVRNNVFRNIEARGILARGNGNQISGNTIDGTTISGIWVGPEIGFYSEGDFARNVIVENNTLRNIGLSWRSRPSPTIGAINVVTAIDDAAIRQTAAGHGQNENITIRGNTIENSAMAGIFVSDSVNVRVCNNRISGNNILDTASGGTMYGLKADKAIIVNDSANVQLSNNQVSNSGVYSTGERYVAQNARNVVFDTPEAVQACAK